MLTIMKLKISGNNKEDVLQKLLLATLKAPMAGRLIKCSLKSPSSMSLATIMPTTNASQVLFLIGYALLVEIALNVLLALSRKMKMSLTLIPWALMKVRMSNKFNTLLLKMASSHGSRWPLKLTMLKLVLNQLTVRPLSTIKLLLVFTLMPLKVTSLTSVPFCKTLRLATVRTRPRSSSPISMKAWWLWDVMLDRRSMPLLMLVHITPGTTVVDLISSLPMRLLNGSLLTATKWKLPEVRMSKVSSLWMVSWALAPTAKRAKSTLTLILLSTVKSSPMVQPQPVNSLPGFLKKRTLTLPKISVDTLRKRWWRWLSTGGEIVLATWASLKPLSRSALSSLTTGWLWSTIGFPWYPNLCLLKMNQTECQSSLCFKSH